MKRIAGTILVFLLLGAIVNMAVAWACARFSPDPADDFYFSRDMFSGRAYDHYWLDHRPESFPPGKRWTICEPNWDSFGVRTVFFLGGFREDWDGKVTGIWTGEEWYEVPRLHWNTILDTNDHGLPEAVVDSTAAYEMQFVETGWPCYSMIGHIADRKSLIKPSYELVECSGILIGTRTGNEVFKRAIVIPFRPIWPGFIINTAFYATILLLLIGGPGMVRRRLRRQKGRCPSCGYNLRGDLPVGCPECGWGRGDESSESESRQS